MSDLFRGNRLPPHNQEAGTSRVGSGFTGPLCVNSRNERIKAGGTFIARLIKNCFQRRK